MAGRSDVKMTEEFYKKVAGSKELQEELKATSDEMPEKNFTAFVRAQGEGEMDDEDTVAVAGGMMALPTSSQQVLP